MEYIILGVLLQVWERKKNMKFNLSVVLFTWETNLATILQLLKKLPHFKHVFAKWLELLVQNRNECILYI